MDNMGWMSLKLTHPVYRERIKKNVEKTYHYLSRVIFDKYFDVPLSRLVSTIKTRWSERVVCDTDDPVTNWQKFCLIYCALRCIAPSWDYWKIRAILEIAFSYKHATSDSFIGNSIIGRL